MLFDLTIFRKADGTQYQQAICLNNTATTLERMGRHEEALTVYHSALKLDRSLPDNEQQ